MDPRYVQWQTFRPGKRQGQPWNEDNSSSNQNSIIRPILQPSQGRANRQQTQRRGGCCGKRATD